MATISLNPKHFFTVPVEAECIAPDVFAGKDLNEIAALPVWEGNRNRNLGELFEVEGHSADEPTEMTIRVLGDVHKVRRIGAGMTAGEIMIHQDAGLHLGEEMKGGKIIVGGNSASWTGAMMSNGFIEVKGNAGHYVGAAYRGSIKGMRGGTIIVHGHAGNEVGCFMRNGLIKVCRNVGQFAGIHMKNGTIHICGNADNRAGAEMVGGKIVINGYVPSILPSFSIEEIKAKVKVNGQAVQGPFYLFVGDLSEKGNGKLYVAKNANPHLKIYDRYL